MTRIRTIAAHEVVRKVHPRPPPTEQDEIARATGHAIDSALSQWSHAARQHIHPTASSIARMAHDLLDEGLRDADVAPTAEQTAIAERQIQGVLQAFRKSVLFGLTRPRSRMILVNGQVGVYAQPDFWDGSAAFYEMKTFRAVPPSAEVELQVRIFQLAFPGLRSVIVGFDRHVDPVATVVGEVPPSTPERRAELLRLLHQTGLELGQEKVLEYIDVPKVAYAVDPSTEAPKAPPGPSASVSGSHGTTS